MLWSENGNRLWRGQESPLKCARVDQPHGELQVENLARWTTGPYNGAQVNRQERDPLKEATQSIL
jgi:hypothetical protein